MTKIKYINQFGSQKNTIN